VDIEVDLSDDAEEVEEETGDSDDSNDTNGGDSDSDEDDDEEEEADSDDATEPSVVTKQVASSEKVIKDKNANLVIIKEKRKSSV
jgi:hypothetical protein